MSDPFFEAYDRVDVAYGIEPSVALQSFLTQMGNPARGRALDLGAGAGRDSLALAAAGFDVTSVDQSERGLQRLRERAIASGLTERITTICADVREFEIAENAWDAVVATTVLDHMLPEQSLTVWQRITEALTDHGLLYCQVHTVDDPGCPRLPGCNRADPISETAAMVVNYFEPNQLARWGVATQSRLRILRYEERLEWDRTHGPEHLHGKAVLLAVRAGYFPDWFGHPIAFPRPNA